MQRHQKLFVWSIGCFVLASGYIMSGAWLIVAAFYVIALLFAAWGLAVERKAL